MATVTETVILTAGTTWSVPYTWNNDNNSVICIGGGAGGMSSPTAAFSPGGGGGGARAISNNVSLTPGASISIAIGAGGGANASGGDTSFNSGAVLAKGGTTPASTSTAGLGGNTTSSVGTTKYAGGNGGSGSTTAGNSGGGGGAGGSTAAGSNGTVGSGGAGGAGGATGGGAGAAAVSGGAGTSGFIGYDNGASAAGVGSNYAGGGGGSGGYASDKAGASYFAGGVGAVFGGGGGGGGVGGAGAQGAIIVSWTWQSVLPTSGQLAMSEIAVAVKKTTTGINLNDSDVRTAFGKASGAIAVSDGYGKYYNPTVVGYINTTGTGTSPLALGSSWQTGDLAIAFIESYSTYPTIDMPGWTFISSSRANDSPYSYWMQAWYRVLQSSDTKLDFTESSFGVHLVILRGASKATALSVANTVGGTTLSFSGITKASNSKALLSCVSDRDPGASGITVPTGWTQSGAASWTNAYVKSGIINSASYTNGTTITWTNFGNYYNQMGILLEIT